MAGMKTILLLPIVLALLVTTAGCVTAADLRAVADSVERLETVVDDETASPADVNAALATAKAEIAEVADAVEERSEGFLDALTSPNEGGVAGLVSLAAAVGLHFYRNRQRVARGEPVKTPPKA